MNIGDPYRGVARRKKKQRHGEARSFKLGRGVGGRVDGEGDYRCTDVSTTHERSVRNGAHVYAVEVGDSA